MDGDRPGRASPDWTGPDPTGPDPTGPDPTGPDPTGPDPTGPDPTGTELSVPGRNGPDGPHIPAQWAVGVVREAIGRVAPRELAVFGSVADTWLAAGGQSRRPRRRPGPTVGFGIDSVLLAELAFPILTGALGEVLGNVVWERVGPRRRSARHRSAAQDSVTETTVTQIGVSEIAVTEVSVTGASAAPDSAAPDSAASDGTPGELAGRGIEFTGQQMRDLRDACRRHGVTLGLPADTAELLADAVVGALHSTPSGP
jgi:hypothetical protein